MLRKTRAGDGSISCPRLAKGVARYRPMASALNQPLRSSQLKYGAAPAGFAAEGRGLAVGMGGREGLAHRELASAR